MSHALTEDQWRKRVANRLVAAGGFAPLQAEVIADGVAAEIHKEQGPFETVWPSPKEAADEELARLAREDNAQDPSQHEPEKQWLELPDFLRRDS